MLIETSTVAPAKTKLELDGPKFYARFDVDEKRIFARCKTDLNNEPAIYTTHKRGVKLAWAALESALSQKPDLTLANAMQVLHNMNIRYHYWCMVD